MCKLGDYNIEVPWSPDYYNTVQDTDVHYIDCFSWNIEFGFTPFEDDKKEAKLTRLRGKTIKDSVKTICDGIIKHYAPLLIAEKAYILMEFYRLIVGERKYPEVLGQRLDLNGA